MPVVLLIILLRFFVATDRLAAVPNRPSDKKQKIIIAIVLSVFFVILIVLIFVVYVIVKKRKSHNQKRLPANSGHINPIMSPRYETRAACRAVTLSTYVHTYECMHTYVCTYITCILYVRISPVLCMYMYNAAHGCLSTRVSDNISYIHITKRRQLRVRAYVPACVCACVCVILIACVLRFLVMELLQRYSCLGPQAITSAATWIWRILMRCRLTQKLSLKVGVLWVLAVWY